MIKHKISQLRPWFEDKNLWDVITALRGPDVIIRRAFNFVGDELVVTDENVPGTIALNENRIKAATTGVIRYHIVRSWCLDPPFEIINGHGYGYWQQTMLGPDSDFSARIRRSLIDNGLGIEHFVTHVANAFRSLGLTWDGINE